MVILVAEDDVTVCELTLKQLAELGLSGHKACNGQEVLECVLKQRYDLILMDIKMPGMDGFEAAKAIRMAEMITNSRHTPVIAMTGVLDRSTCLSRGLDDFVAKPVMLDLLKAVLSRWLPLPAAVMNVIAATRLVMKRRRESIGLTHQELAKKAGLTETYVKFLEEGSQDFELLTLNRLARALDLGVSELVAWAELIARE